MERENVKELVNNIIQLCYENMLTHSYTHVINICIGVSEHVPLPAFDSLVRYGNWHACTYVFVLMGATVLERLCACCCVTIPHPLHILSELPLPSKISNVHFKFYISLFLI